MSESLREPSDSTHGVIVPEWARGRKPPRDPETGQLWPRRCELYISGHTVHHIQALRSHDAEKRVGRLAAVEGNVITVDFNGEIEHYRNHEPERLLEIIGIGGTVIVCSSFSLLKSESGSCFSIAQDDGPWRPCDYQPLNSAKPDALAERLETHGGFLVPGDLILDEING